MRKLINYLHRLLLDNEEMMKYLKDRGMTIEMIKKFKLGKFPDEPVNVLRYADAKFLIDDAEILYSSFNGFKSMFSRNKLIIPIYDVYNDLIGIAGRILVSDEVIKKHGLPKYVNSKYNKRSHLFGLNIAKDVIRDKNEAFIVEGYFDVISAHQAGFKNVVAACGTAFGNGQVNLLARYTDRFNILFDNDPPGRVAADTILKKQKSKKRIKIIKKQIKEFNDLDELLRSGKTVEEYVE